jgi:hypothetical protein
MAIGWRWADSVMSAAGTTGSNTQATSTPGSSTGTSGMTEGTGTQSTSTPGTQASSSTAEGGAAHISVNDQPAGMAATVSSVTLPAAGWVAVHELGEDGVLGNVLGAAWLPAGTHADAIVTLLRATKPDQQYAIVLYTDNGNKQFDLHADTPIAGSNGQPVTATFTATTPVAPAGQ